MNEKLSGILDKYREIERNITLPDVISDNGRYSALMKEYKSLTPLAEACFALRSAEDELDGLAKMLEETQDPEMRQMIRDEIVSLSEKKESTEEQIKILLIPKDPDDDRNTIVEIRQGTGGEEAALFAYDLFRMYSMYLSRLGFSLTVTEANETELGGFKNVTFLVKGVGAYAKMKYESGVHRVQRIPVTESNGRIQTSAVSVAVLPEAEDVEIAVSPSDIRFESCKSSGAGGQHINKTESAVRLTHVPSGIVVECDTERSQLQNKETAMRILRTKLYDIKIRERDEKIASERKSQIGSGDRSEKIRTYNYPQSRVTDHRINKTIYSLESFMNGDMDDMILALTNAETAEKLKGETL